MELRHGGYGSDARIVVTTHDKTFAEIFHCKLLLFLPYESILLHLHIRDDNVHIHINNSECSLCVQLLVRKGVNIVKVHPLSSIRDSSQVRI